MFSKIKISVRYLPDTQTHDSIQNLNMKRNKNKYNNLRKLKMK